MNDFIPDYLQTKQTVDDRALNQRVWQAFWEALPGSSRQFPLEMLELGAGTGAMTKRIVDSGKISTLMYTAVDSEQENLDELKVRSAAWLEKRPFIHLFSEVNTAEAYVAAKQGEQYFDAVLAHAFIDLVDLDSFLPALLELLPVGGIGYFTINFDGETRFQPSHPADGPIVAAYHASMSTPHTGRRLLHKLTQLGTEILAAGSSDWIVFPTASQYPADEKHFLLHIINFFERSLSGPAESSGVDQDQLADWLQVRRTQIEAGELVFIAHQLDVVFKKTAD